MPALIAALVVALLPLMLRGVAELGWYLEQTEFGKRIIELEKLN